MLSAECLHELHTVWLPHMTDAGVDRLIELLGKGSQLLIHGCFSRAVPMGCLATHAAWHHPRTAHLNVEAGISWLNLIAGLKPASSRVIHEWDCGTPDIWRVQGEFLSLLQTERRRRSAESSAPAHHVPAEV